MHFRHTLYYNNGGQFLVWRFRKLPKGEKKVKLAKILDFRYSTIKSMNMLTLTNIIVFIPMQAIIIGDEKQLHKQG